MKRNCTVRLLILTYCWLTCMAVRADVSANQASASRPVGKSVLKAYCGVRCLYAAAIAEGMPLTPTDLVRPEYIGSKEGSSIEELQRAATDHGLHAFAFANGNIAILSAASHPVILHVESQAGTSRYDHFVLYLGHRGDKLLILDTTAPPGEPAREVDDRDLSLIWDGAGIVISKNPITGTLATGSVWTFALLGIAIIVLAIVAKAGATWKGRPSLRFPLGAAGEALAILTAAFAAPALSALCADSGLLAHQAQIKQVEQTNAAYFLPRISFAQARKAIESGSAVFVDARYAADYSAGHLPSAINVPASSTDQLVRLLMAGIPKEKLVIVYCQSKSCPFSKTVATSLLFEGYSFVKLLDGGWEEWSAWKQ